MTIEQTIEIPADRRIYLDLPPQIPAGKARITVQIIEYSHADSVNHSPVEAFNNENEATEFATRLSKRIINEAW
jgi:hypothetical protein